MKKQINKLIKFIKKQRIKGCITGSVLLDYFPDQDVDVFIYDINSFRNLLNTLYNNKLFTILDKRELWKFEHYMYIDSSWKNQSLITIKFTYNTCIPLNIIFKKDCNNIFSVISTFDMDIISRGYDIETKQFLDLCEYLPNKQVTWNKWNTKLYIPGVWSIGKILRQLERCFKYHKRGYNTDKVILKYIELIEEIQKESNLFDSDVYDEKLQKVKANTKTVKKLCKVWLKTHSINDKQIELLKTKIKEI